MHNIITLVQLGKKLQNSQESFSAVICFLLGRDYNAVISLIYESYQHLDNSRSTQSDKDFALQEIFEELVVIKSVLEYGDNYHQETEQSVMV